MSPRPSLLCLHLVGHPDESTCQPRCLASSLVSSLPAPGVRVQPAGILAYPLPAVPPAGGALGPRRHPPWAPHAGLLSGLLAVLMQRNAAGAVRPRRSRCAVACDSAGMVGTASRDGPDPRRRPRRRRGARCMFSQQPPSQGLARLQDPLGHRPELRRTGADPGTFARQLHPGRLRIGPHALAGAAAVAARTHGGGGCSAGLPRAGDPRSPPWLLRMAARWRPLHRDHRVPSHPLAAGRT
jgi:hypothetical protein